MVFLLGIVISVLCDLFRHIPETGTLPLNAVFSLIGVPVILWVLLKGKNWFASS